MKSNLTAAALAVLAVCTAALVFDPASVVAQQPSTAMPSNQMMQGQSEVATPTMPGQDAFGAIQEIVRMLEADPNTDWSKVTLEALRQHLIDMNEVTLKAEAVAKPVDGGIEVTVSGAGALPPFLTRSTLYFTQQLEPKFSGAEVRNAFGASVNHDKSISSNMRRVCVLAMRENDGCPEPASRTGT